MEGFCGEEESLLSGRQRERDRGAVLRAVERVIARGTASSARLGCYFVLCCNGGTESRHVWAERDLPLIRVRGVSWNPGHFGGACMDGSDSEVPPLIVQDLVPPCSARLAAKE